MGRVDDPVGIRHPRRSAWVAALPGIGVMAAVDEIVFHQILGWHHFYDRSTPAIGLISDGLLHAASLVILVAGFFLLADLVRRRALVPRAAWAGFLLGAGAFQVFDGIVDHKLLRLHQIRYGVHLAPYDVVWNLGGLVLLAVGAALLAGLRRDASRTGSAASRTGSASSRGGRAARGR